MYKVTVVEAAWSKQRAFLVGAVIAAISIVLWWGLDQCNEAWHYEMPDLLFFPLFFGILLFYPILALITSYRRLPKPMLGLVYSLGFGVGWHVAMWALQTAEYGPWKGFRVDERSMLNLVLRQVQYLLPTVGISVGIGMGLWGLCRLFRGKVLIQDGSLCATCGYPLVGNVSGVCPECGSKRRVGGDRP